MKSYCVKQKKQAECVPRSERYMKAKNGRNMIKCTCAECGITMVKFVKQETKCALTSWGQYISTKEFRL